MNRATTVLIVDDETPIRQWFEFVIRQHAEEFAIVGLASNGAEAVQLYDKHHPQIIITDIRMPVMSGLEVIEAVAARGRQAEFLILSNYDDFQYVKKGFMLGAKDYLLKAETDDRDIISALRKLKNEAQLSLPALHSSIKETVIRDYLKHKAADLPSIGHVLQDLDKLPPHTKYALCCSIDHYEQWRRERAGEAGLTLIGAELDRMLRERLKATQGYMGMAMDDKEYLVIFAAILSGREIIGLMEENGEYINKELQAKYGCTVSLSLSGGFSGLPELRAGYEEARQALNDRFYAGAAKLHAAQAPGSGVREGQSEALQKQLNELAGGITVMDKGMLERVKAFLSRLLLSDKASQIEPDAARQMTVSLIELLRHKLLSLAGQAEQPLQLPPVRLDEYSEFAAGFYQAAIHAVEQMLEAAHNHLYRYSEATNKIMRYLERHYGERMEMSRLAELVHLNENYISQLFKKETGQTVTQFLVSVRMKQAKRLLQENQLKVNEIASAVGYGSESHFCTAFKLYYGKSPTKFAGHLRNLQ